MGISVAIATTMNNENFFLTILEFCYVNRPLCENEAACNLVWTQTFYVIKCEKNAEKREMQVAFCQTVCLLAN